MNNECPVCQKKSKSTVSVYDKQGKSLNLKLCYLHDIELYKIGQMKFISKYKSQLAINIGEIDEFQ